ncbi:MAG: hypothetical protein CMH61_02130 [Nanoarchaeota archaeon]|nr:hypothetical protein [Nanoarchaeota archaeon]|tara:strand:+ start:494 stop:1090 length:597 start_codon:yes stop_codon:yes gene_type:complete
MAELIDGPIVEIDWPEPVVKPKAVKPPADYFPISMEEQEPVSVSGAISELTNNSDFPEIYHRTKSIDDVAVSWSFLVRRCYEIGSETGQNIGAIAQNNTVQFQKALEEYGLHFLCPYFEYTGKPPTNEKCHLNVEIIDSVCAGKNYQCDFFKRVAEQVAWGNDIFPSKLTLPIKYKIPEVPFEPVDLQDWWEGEEKYA